MSGPSSSVVEWFSKLVPTTPPLSVPARPDDPRLGEVVEFWRGDRTALRPGRPVLIGFPQDEGVRRNSGRVGAAEAPDEIRRWLYRLTTGGRASDPDLGRSSPLDAGNIRIVGGLEETQKVLGEVVAEVLRCGAVPIVLGGGHETAYGSYLGYVAAGQSVGIINLDAHLDVRPLIAGQGHSGSPFRQALEHPSAPLGRQRYVCLGVQPHATSRDHARYAQEHGCVIRWSDELKPGLGHHLSVECDRLASQGCRVHVSIDADVVSMAEMPGVSAPNPSGLSGAEVLLAARLAGSSPQVSSLELVEINPRLDRDGQSARWAAVLVWNFVVGLLGRVF